MKKEYQKRIIDISGMRYDEKVFNLLCGVSDALGLDFLTTCYFLRNSRIKERGGGRI